MTKAPDTPRPRIAEPTTTSPTATGLLLPSWLITAAVVIPPALLMLVVGGFRLRRPSLGWDENGTWLVSQRTPGQIIEQARHFDGVHSPYYMFMHFWTSVFGDSEFWLRAPALIAVAVGVGVAADLGRRLFGPGVGLLTGLFLVLVPQLSRYAQDARAHGFVFLFATLATLLLYRALERRATSGAWSFGRRGEPGKNSGWGRWIAYAVVVTLVGWAQVLGLLMLLGHAYAVLSRWRSGRDRAVLRWLVVTPIALVPVLPVLYLGFAQRGSLDWLPPMTVEEVWAAPGDIFGSAAAGLLLIGLALLARSADPRPVRELAVLAVLPPIVLIAVSFIVSPLWVPRYVLFIVPAFAILAAVGLGGLRVSPSGSPAGLAPGARMPGEPGARMPGEPGARVPGEPGKRPLGGPGARVPGEPGARVPGEPGAGTPGAPGARMRGRLTLRGLLGANLRVLLALVLLAAVAIPAQLSVRGYASHMGANFRTVARIIASHQQPGDVIVYGASGTWSLRAGIDYQLRHQTKPRDVLLQRPAAEVGQLNAVQCADQVACLGTSPRVWFFRQWQSGPPLSDAGALTATLQNDYRRAGVWHTTKATLVLFERR